MNKPITEEMIKQQAASLDASMLGLHLSVERIVSQKFALIAVLREVHRALDGYFIETERDEYLEKIEAVLRECGE